MTWIPTVENCDTYMDERTGKYEYRAVRYAAAGDMIAGHAINNGLDLNSMTIYDVGAGMTEFDYFMRTEHDWRGRYIPIDGGIDGTDINNWVPQREAHWFVALEILEHLKQMFHLMHWMQQMATVGIVVSTPNPATTDVLAMDPTHVREVHPEDLERYGFTVYEEFLYGGVFSEGKPDSLLGVWHK